MPVEDRCEHAQLELSLAHDEHRPPSATVADHVATCETCTPFEQGLENLDRLLGRNEFGESPDIASAVTAVLPKQRPQWWWPVAVAAAIGIFIGALVGGIGTRFDVVHAQDLDDRFHAASPSVVGLSAELLVVERGWHPDVPERVYVGSLSYSSPEQLAIDLVDTTAYPGAQWVPNDVLLEIADGDTVSVASARCPVAAIPGCLRPASTRAIGDQRPFDDGVIIPLEIVGPGRSLAWWSGIEVVGTPELDGRPTIQVETTVAGVDLIQALTDQGAWRELHPTDRVLLWLDEDTLVPIRVEVFAIESPERELWQLRRGYEDDPDGEPIFIIQLSDIRADGADVEPVVPEDAPSGGFVDIPVVVPPLDLPPGFTPHRSGTWSLPEGGLVDVATWSDGRSWVMVETTDTWTEGHLFGISLPFVRRIDLGGGSVGYVDPSGEAIAIHGARLDVLVSGSASEDVLRQAAASLDVQGLPVPEDWAEASVLSVADLPAGTLIPEVDGWSILGVSDADRVTILLTGGGSRAVSITQAPGSQLDPPIGPDFSAVAVRGTTGRFNAAASTLEWIEDGRLVQMRSDTVGMVELLELAAALSVR